MNIDCHGHFTTAPRELLDWRRRQIELFQNSGQYLDMGVLTIGDDEIQTAIDGGQIPLQNERETEVTILSPIAGLMAHHYGDERLSQDWARVANDMIHRVCSLYPRRFVGACQLPQSPNCTITASVNELRRCVQEMDFVACNLNPDPSDGFWSGPPLTDPSFYPLYEVMVELDVPAMLHVSMSCNSAVHGPCAHYLNGDTTVFMQLAVSGLFNRFPKLRFVIPHGGGAVPYHWGRYKGALQDLDLPKADEFIADNIFFDTCVYWQPGLELLLATIPAMNILYASEMIGAVRGIDATSGRRYDDTKFLLDRIEMSEADRHLVMGGNALRVYGRLAGVLKSRGYELDAF